MRPGDEIKVKVGEFKDGAILVRFKNPADVPYSAIYKNDMEIASCNREQENRMVYWYRDRIGDISER